MKAKDEIVLGKIIDRIDTILRYCDGYDGKRFEENTMLVEACVFNILQIGELSKQALSDAFKEEYSFIPWKQMNGMRNRIVHGYEGVTLNIVWDTIREDLPELRKRLCRIQEELGG